MDRTDTVLKAAAVAMRLGKPRQGIAITEAALRHVDPLTDPIRAGLLHTRRGQCLHGTGAYDEAFAAYEQAMRVLPSDPPSIERADLLLTQVNALLIAAADPHKIKAACEQALATAQHLNSEQEVGRALTQLSAAQALLGQFDEAITAAREACRIAEKHADVHNLGGSYEYLGDALMRAGRLAESADESLRGREVLHRLGLDDEWDYDFLAVNAAQALFPLGRWNEADQLARSALNLGVADEPVRELAVAAIEVGRGEFAAADDRLAKIRERSLHGRKDNGGIWLECFAELRGWQGRLDDAHAAVERGLDLLPGTYEQACIGRLLCLGMRAQADRAEQARARRDRQTLADAERAAASLEARAQALARNPVLPWVTSPWTTLAQAAVWAGERSRLQGRTDPALWHAAAAGWLALHQPYPAAYARWREAEALLATRGSRTQATATLRQAHQTTVRLRATPLQQEIEGLARRGRLDLSEPTPAASAPPMRPPADPFGLTRREREVLQLIAEGRTNPQIATTLFISVKTASTHVSNVLAKLGVASRVEAAGVAHRGGLVNDPSRSPNVASRGGMPSG